MEVFGITAQYMQQARYLYAMASAAYRGDVATTLSQLARHYEALALAPWRPEPQAAQAAESGKP